jgi:hypothetical protein
MVKPAPTAPCVEKEHGHVLRAPAFLGGGGAPALLKRRDQNPVEALLAETGTEEGRGKMAKSRAADRDARHRMRLWQPVHRVFHLAVVEASCQRYGDLRIERRIDPKRIVGSGIVIRRLVPPLDAQGRPRDLSSLSREQLLSLPVQGWMRDEDDRIMGWQTLAINRGLGTEQDPDPEHRLPDVRAGHPAITHRLAARAPLSKLKETIHPLFVAPPEKCAAAGSTLLYGVLPLTSSELTEDVPAPPVADDETANQMVPELLLPVARGNAPTEAEAVKDRATTVAWTLPIGTDLKTPPADPAQQAEFDARQRDLSLLHALGAFAPEVVEGSEAWRAMSPLEQETARAARLLRAHLDQIAVWDKLPAWSSIPTVAEMDGWDPYLRNGHRFPHPVNGYGWTPWGNLPEWKQGPWPRPARRLGKVLTEASAIFTSTGATGQLAKSEWRLPRAAAWHRDLRTRIKALLNVRMDEMTSGVSRYDRGGALYIARAFVRVKRCDACPPELLWSAPTEPFSIVPWFEPSGAPPVRVEMPEATLESLAKLKPNVAFKVPASLQSMLNAMQVKKPLDVSKGGGGGTDLAWICGFNIPIITLCAFVVLSIFLSLLNIIFWWLPLVKICIPIPKSSPSERL